MSVWNALWLTRALWFPQSWKTRNVTEFAKFGMDKSKLGQYSSIKTWYGLVSVNIKPQKDYLNVTPACSACLCVN